MTSKEQGTWELGGLTDLSGTLRRKVPHERWWAPAVASIHDDALVWSGVGKRIQPGRGMLEGFIALSDARSAAVLAYAKRWGPLFWSLAQCDWDRAEVGYEIPQPYVRDHDHDPDDLDHAHRDYTFESAIDGGTESLAVWRKYGRRARAALRIAAEINVGGSNGELQDWRDMTGDSGDELPDHREDALDRFCQALDWWLYLAGVRPRVSMRGPSIEFSSDGLFGALGLQLALVAVRRPGLASCSSCGRPYLPSRRLQSGRSNYCPSCGLAAARRDASARYRERQRQSLLG